MKSLRWLLCLNLVALIAVSIWFRCRDLGNMPGINGDEAWYGVQAELVLHGEPITWRTPTGNLLNPLFFGPQLLLHAVFEPSFALLRSTAVLSGLLALAVNYCLCRKVFDRRTAVVSTAILAVLPINIVYSRLAWDASQSLLVTSPAIYWPLRAIIVPQRRLWFSAGGLIALAAAIIVHPTNLFVGPFVGVCLVVAWADELRRIGRHSTGKVGALVAAFGFVALTGFVAQSRLPAILSRLTDPAGYAAFAVNVGRLFSGATVFQYVSGSISPTADPEWLSGTIPYYLGAGLIACLIGWGIYKQMTVRPRLREPNSEHEKTERMEVRLFRAKGALVVGWSLSLFALFVIGGPAAIAPHFERYGLCLIGPGAILAALAMEWWIDVGGRPGRIAAAGAILCGWGLLAGFQANFFDFIEQTGGESHLTFRTARIEPKAAAFRVIYQRSSNARVLASEWWVYWPLEYLSFQRPPFPDPQAEERLGRAENSARRRITIEQYTELRERADVVPGYGEQIWVIEFTGAPACESVRKWGRERQVPISESIICDYGGRPLLSLFEIGVSSTKPSPPKNP
jgi:hypothetical protein